MKSHPTYFYLSLLGALSSLFISYWFSPYAIALLLNFAIRIELKKAIWSHFLMYTVLAVMYCAWVWSTGSQRLIQMIGEIFLGSSPWLMILVSSLFFGITAALGAWSGWALRTLVQGTKA